MLFTSPRKSRLALASMFCLCLTTLGMGPIGWGGLNPCLLVTNGEYYKLNSDATWPCVMIVGNGVLDTNGYKLTISYPGGLTMKPNSMLLISSGTVNPLGGGTHTIQGEIALASADSVLHITAHTTLTGSGEVRGYDEDAEIRIRLNNVLTNEISITGALTVSDTDGGGGLINDGVICADRACDKLTLANGVEVWDSGPLVGSEFSATDGGILCFQDHAALWSDFTLDGGTLLVDGNYKLYTCGELTFNSGSTIEPGDYGFGYTSYAGWCGNPADEGDGTACVGDPYWVYTTKVCGEGWSCDEETP